MDEHFSVEFEQSDQTGKWRGACPICAMNLDGLTHYGAECALLDHLNAQHAEGRFGHA